ncbi:LacI family DNA-binding transcriptional regulator [Nocardioides mangrovi]|uniref:LacI family transcriptional regulator n=1 Tax=Nocardioides mangrovi TaxID=2874580 RepID=A0ABS7UCY8_9ACTN|nr:LacI family DNA-binding transcriptional regulator [Nocardioides mangrovi]MBZ5738841.1 LacI family transcriptional regulator [Nocardioides mangrovi]
MKDEGAPGDATIYDVAREAGVSIATVSNVMNKPDRVGEQTRQRVLEVADRFGYVPKAKAASLARKHVGRIGVIAPFTTYASFMRRLSGVLSEAAGRGVDISVFDMESAATAASPVLESIPIRGSVDGLIVMGEPLETAVEQRLASRNMPVVVIDADSDSFHVVKIDDYRAGRLAARHLVDLGHRHIGYLLEGQVADYESQALRRLGGFQAELALHPGIELTVSQSVGTLAAAREAGRRLLDVDHRPTAVMAHFDDLAVGVMHAAKDLGISVPESLSVLGFDDGPVAESADLSTVRQPFEESGALAARLLLDALERPTERHLTVLDCTLVPRSTTAAPAERTP